MLTVTTRANSTALTTLSNVKLSLAIKDRTNDVWLGRQIDVVSQQACEILGVEMADDGSRDLGVETVNETQDRRTRYPWLPPLGVIRPRREADTIIILGRRPVIAISSITENGVAVDPCDYELFATDGRVKRLSSAGCRRHGRAPSSSSATPPAGSFPGDDASVSGPALPAPIEEAVIEGIQAKLSQRTRDLGVRSETIPGVRTVEYFFGAPGQDQPLPPSAMSKLNPYRNMSL